MTDYAGQYPDSFAPFSAEAEEATLGALLSNANAYYQVSLFLKADDFFLLRHQRIWQAIERIVARGEEGFDFLTVGNELHNMRVLDEIGGQGYLLRLVNNTPTSVNAEVYARIIEKAALRRRLLTAADEIKGLALAEEMPIEEVKQQSQARLFDVMESQVEDRMRPIFQIMNEYLDKKEAIYASTEPLVGLSTGFDDIDKLTGGLEPDNVYVIAGATSMGKSAFAAGLARYVAQPRPGKRTKKVVVWTGEMSAQQVTDRYMASLTGFDLLSVRNPRLLTDTQYTTFVTKMGELAEYGLHIDDTPGITPQELYTKCYIQQQRGGLDLVIVDYMGLMSMPKMEAGSTAEMTAISRGMKSLARRLHVPVVALAQLSRGIEKRQDKRPYLSDLRQSGAIEQDADLVAFLYREEYYNPETEYKNVGEFIVAKQRNGPKGIVPLYFESETATYKPLATNHIDLGRWDEYDPTAESIA